MGKKLGITAVVCAVALGVTTGYVRMNQSYPQSVKEEVNQGEKIEYQTEVFLTADSYYIYSEEESEQVNEEMGSAWSGTLRLAEVSVTLLNETEEEQKLEMTDLYLCTNGQAQGISKQVIDSSRGDYGALQLTLQPGEEKQVVYPYELREFFFKEKEWKTLEDREFWLTFSSYPTETVIKLEQSTQDLLE